MQISTFTEFTSRTRPWRAWDRHALLSLYRNDSEGRLIIAARSRLTAEQAEYFEELLEDMLSLQKLYEAPDDTDDLRLATRAQELAVNSSVAQLLRQGVRVLWRPGVRNVAIELICLRGPIGTTRRPVTAASCYAPSLALREIRRAPPSSCRRRRLDRNPVISTQEQEGMHTSQHERPTQETA